MPVLKANIKNLTCRIIEITQFLFCSLYMHMYFDVVSTKDALLKTNSTVSFHFLYILYPHYLWLTDE